MSPFQKRTWSRRLLAGVLVACLAAAAGVATLWISLPSVTSLATRMPKATALLEQRRAEAKHAGRAYAADIRPVPLDRISPRLAEAVVLSEDSAFFGHSGFDWREIRNAAEQNLRAGRTVRGASTITQQLAKNLYLGTERSYSRKLKEAVLALKLERTLSKRRILAVYLNAVEWGPGVFGAEAAARRWFDVSANDLDVAQSVALAAMLPAPRRARLSPAPGWLAKRARRILGYMRQTGKVDDEEYVRAAGELERMLGEPPPSTDTEPTEDSEDDDASSLDSGSAAPAEPGHRPL